MTTKLEQAARQALEALHNTQNALLFVSGSIEQFIISNMTADAHDDADKAITALREALKENEMAKIEGINMLDRFTSAEQAEQKPVGYFAYDEEHDIWEELTGPNAPGATPLYTAPQPVEQEPVAKIALKNCIYFDSIDFNQNPPYLRYDTGDSTSKENWTIYCDIQEELRKNGYELTDSDVDHDTVCGDVTPMAAPVRTKDLTDEELNDMWYGNTKDGWLGLFRAVIAADREKNNV